MSLYYEAASFLDQSILTNQKVDGALKNRIYAAKGLKNKPANIFALIAETLRWSSALAPVISASTLVEEEHILTPTLALLLCHDLLMTRDGIHASQCHGLTIAVQRHQVRLRAEFTRARVRAGFSSLDAWGRARTAQESRRFSESASAEHDPSVQLRWVRINTLRTTLALERSEGVLQGWKQIDSVQDMVRLQRSGLKDLKVFALDKHVPDLIATSAKVDWTHTSVYLGGIIILQNKASCFPALLMDPKRICRDGGDIIDACAAPGNKTTHLCALMGYVMCLHAEEIDDPCNFGHPEVIAADRSPKRAESLRLMVKTAGADKYVTIRAKQDFLRLKPDEESLTNVSGILLDPSCSGSGIFGRNDDDEHDVPRRVILPERNADAATQTRGKNNRKRKRKNGKQATKDSRLPLKADSTKDMSSETSDFGTTQVSDEDLRNRLKKLSNFQVTMLKHAMTFPKCTRIVYSTCSIYAEENEHVVLEALLSKTGVEYGEWKPLKRKIQPEGLQKWSKRGNRKALTEKAKSMNVDLCNEYAEDLADACIRCEKNTEEGTTGFFVCGFERELQTLDAPQPRSKEPSSPADEEDTDEEERDKGEIDEEEANEGEADEEGDEWAGFDD